MNECEAFSGDSSSGRVEFRKQIVSADSGEYAFSISKGMRNIAHISLGYVHCDRVDGNFDADLYFELDTAVAVGDTVLIEDSALSQIHCVYGIDYFQLPAYPYDWMQPVVKGSIQYYKLYDAVEGDFFIRVEIDTEVSDPVEDINVKKLRYTIDMIN